MYFCSKNLFPIKKTAIFFCFFEEKTHLCTLFILKYERMIPLFRQICLSGLALLAGCVLVACQSVFDVHPYDMNLHGEHDINATQIARIRQLYNLRDTLRIAFISDTQCIRINNQNCRMAVHAFPLKG